MFGLDIQSSFPAAGQKPEQEILKIIERYLHLHHKNKQTSKSLPQNTRDTL